MFKCCIYSVGLLVGEVCLLFYDVIVILVILKYNIEVLYDMYFDWMYECYYYSIEGKWKIEVGYCFSRLFCSVECIYRKFCKY